MVLLVALVIGMAASISLAQIALTALLVWVLLARRAGVLERLDWPLLWPIGAFAVWSAVAALASDWPRDSIFALKSVLTLGTIFVVANALPTADAARRFTTWLILALTGAAVVALVQVASCPGPAATDAGIPVIGKLLRKCARARGFYSIYMTLAGVLAMMLVGALPRLGRLGADARWLGPAWIVGAGALALTYVRGAWVGFVIGAVTAAVGLGRRGIIASVAMLASVGVLIAVLPGVRARAETITDPSNPTSRDRLVMLRVGLQLAGNHPLAGIGPGTVKRAYRDVVPPEGIRRSTSHLHNTPLQLLVERGVVGLAAWLWLFAAFFKRACAILVHLPADAAGDRALTLGSLAAIVTFLVAGLFEYNFGDTEVLMVALAMMAVPFALAADRVAPGGKRFCS